MKRFSALVGYSLAFFIITFFGVGGCAVLVAVVAGYADAWYLLLAALMIWFGCTGANNMRQWFERVPAKRFDLVSNGFLIAGELVRFDQVLLINCNQIISQKTQNFVKAGRDFTVLAEITDREGKVFKLRAGQGPVTWFGPTYGAVECKQMLMRLREGHQRTTALWTAE